MKAKHGKVSRFAALLMVFIMLFTMFPSTAFAGVAQQGLTSSVDTLEVDLKLNDWYEIDLSEYFSDSDGDELTYYVGDQKLDSSVYNYYPAGEGEQSATFKAVDTDGNEAAFTLKANVAEAPSEVKVTISVTDGGEKFYAMSETDKVMVPTEITVPYFDLALYGLEDYYYNPLCYSTHKEGDSEYDNSQVAGTKETAEGIVTVMHAFIYATEVYYLGYDAKDAGTGASYEAGAFQDAVSWTGGVGSSYMNLWDHGTNLNYYVDWAYPSGAPKWGATSDQIALYGGEEIAVHMIESNNAYGSDFTFFTNDGTYDSASQVDEINVFAGEKVDLTLVKTVPDYETFTTEYKAYANRAVRYISADALTGDTAEWTDTGLTTDAEGKVSIDTTGMAGGTYYIAATGMYDESEGTEAGAAIVKMVIETKPAPQMKQGDATVDAVEIGTYENKSVFLVEFPDYASQWQCLKDDVTKYGTSTYRTIVNVFDSGDYHRRRIGTGTASTYKFNASVGDVTKAQIEEKFGVIEGLDDGNKYQALEVRYNTNTGDLLYYLIVEHTITPVETVSLDRTEIAMNVGGAAETIVATVAPENATFKTVTWTSSDESVATVKNGVVTPVAQGKATITATADGVSASCEVDVTYVKANSIILSETSKVCEGGESFKLEATVAPETYSGEVVWSSSNEDVATVTADGTVKTIEKGTVVITASIDGKEAKCEITVNSTFYEPVVVMQGKDSIYNTLQWPGGYKAGINKVTVGGASKCQDSFVLGDVCCITLGNKTVKDGQVTLDLYVLDQRDIWLSIDDVLLDRQYKNETYTHTVQLEDGEATVKIGASSYTTQDNMSKYVYKTFYFSTEGKFDVEPMLTGGNSTSALKIMDETWSIDLAPLFKNVSRNEMTYAVSTDNGETYVPCDAEFVYNCPTSGVNKLLFKANNGIGDSPVYTATITVLDKASIYEANESVLGGTITWFAFTDGDSKPLPEGTTYEYDAEAKKFTITQPMDCVQDGKVITYYNLVKDTPGAKLPLLTGSTLCVGAGTKWDGAVRSQHTSTLAGGNSTSVVYLYEKTPSAVSNVYTTYTFEYKRQLPETYFEYVIEDQSKNTLYGDIGGVNGHEWVISGKNYEARVSLSDVTPLDATIGSKERAKTTTLADGTGQMKWNTGDSFWGDDKYWTISFKINEIPAFAEGIEAASTVSVPALDEYSIDLKEMFVDKDAEDTLIYQVRVDGGAWTDLEGSVYSYIPQTAQDYVLEFRAYDGFAHSSDVHTVTLTATNARDCYVVDVYTEAEDAAFYCYKSVDENGYPVVGDELMSRESVSGFEVWVPINVNKIVFVSGEQTQVIDIDRDNKKEVTLVKTNFVLETLAGDAAEGDVIVNYGEFETKGNGNVFYLEPGEGYTYTATPTGDFATSWTTATAEEQTIVESADVTLQFPVKSPRSFTVDADATFNAYYQQGYYIVKPVAPVLTQDNEDGTITYTFSTPNGQHYAHGYMYLAEKGDLIDKTGYMHDIPIGGNVEITWDDEERTNDYRGATHERGDDSVMVNVNGQNHLVLNEGETFRLRAFRIWEIINTDTENCMIEPEFIYSNYDENIVTMTNANEQLAEKGRVNGVGGNNWMDLTAVGSGTTFMEVGYEALHIVTGHESGSWGGAMGAGSDTTWNAADPARTALVVIQTDGKAATDVSFGIECFTSFLGSEGSYYDETKAMPWDVEFDTLYFLGKYGTLNFAPTAKSGDIAEVAVSSDKGATWTVLEGDRNDEYTAKIYSGNNIIRVTKDDGTTAYQVVRGDKITYDVTLKNDINSNGEVDNGDTVRVTLNGLHNPVGKMSGIYNPGYGKGQRVTYTWDGQNVRQSGYYQYNFVSNAWIDVTIPEDATGEYALTDGYINFNVMGDGPGNHRYLTDNGREINMSAGSGSNTRSILPDIVIRENIELEEAKTVAMQELEKYVDYKDYGKAEQEEIKSIIESAKEQIQAAESNVELDEAVKAAKEAIANVPTDEEAEALHKEKSAAVESLEAYMSENYKVDDYRAEQQAELDAIFAEACEAIESAQNTASIEEAVAAAKAAMDDVKTDAELTAAEADAAAKAELEKQIAELEKALEESKELSAAEKAALEAEIADLAAALEDANVTSAAEKAALEAKIAELQAQIDELSKEPAVVKLDAPANVKAGNVAKSGKIKITWDAVDGADEYVVYRATSKDGSYKKMFTTTGTSYTNTNAVAGKAYWYKVKAVSDDKAVNNSAFSKVVSRTCDYARPVVSAKATDGKVVLTWKKVEGATKYYVYKATSKDGEYKCIGSTTNLKFTNKSNLKAGKTYYYKVKAVGKKNAASAYSIVDSCKIKK